MSLARYHAKRDFNKTPEPRGRLVRRKGFAYLIQKHAASRLHYDFRLELNGTLLSWAIPKGPSLDPADKRLAMHVEDHPLEYGDFEGTIPKGQYGGGTVMIWDRGTWQPLTDAEAALEAGHLKFELFGEKLHGRWALIKTHGTKYGHQADAWLLIKDADEYARRGVDARIVEAEPDSVVSQRSLEEIAAANDAQWHSNRSVAENLRAGAIRRKAAGVARKVPAPASLPGAAPAPCPAWLAPMHTTLTKSAPAGDDWIHEVKYDGYRILARMEKNKVKLFSRNGKDRTDALPDVVAALTRLKLKSAWLDGELCALDRHGRPHFQTLQNALSEGEKAKLVYFLFDVPYLDGFDLTAVPLRQRKQLLAERMSMSQANDVLHLSPEVRGSGPEVFRETCQSGLEGIVAKRADSTYRAGLRTNLWLKIKCEQRQEMVIGGFTDPQGNRAAFGALLLGVYEEGKLRYAGKVGTGFDEKTLATIRGKLDSLVQSEPAFVDPPRGFAAKGAHWVKPCLVAEVRFTEWSEAGALRHPAFVGLREDKEASEVVREAASTAATLATAAEGAAAAPTPRQRTEESNKVAGVALSHPDKLLFPEAGLRKIDIARYYQSIGEWILPHLKDRPLSLVRCPEGWGGQCFYQKHAAPAAHRAVARVEVSEGNGTATYMAANSLQALVGLVQWGVVELHPWGSRMPHPEKPDRLIFDFDPADDVPWQELVAGVKELRTLLEKLGLACFLKTTGGKGLHVVVPIRPTISWQEAKGFTKAIADLFARTFPDRYIANISKAKRQGKILIDYLRNAEGATAIAPYGIRARANAPVATPISWQELSIDVRFDHFNVSNVPARLQKLRTDPWQGFTQVRQSIKAAHFTQVGYRPTK